MFCVYESVGVNNLVLFNHLLRKDFRLQEDGMAASKIISFHVPAIYYTRDDMGRARDTRGKEYKCTLTFDRNPSRVEHTSWSWAYRNVELREENGRARNVFMWLG